MKSPEPEDRWRVTYVFEGFKETEFFQDKYFALQRIQDAFGTGGLDIENEFGDIRILPMNRVSIVTLNKLKETELVANGTVQQSSS